MVARWSAGDFGPNNHRNHQMKPKRRSLNDLRRSPEFKHLNQASLEVAAALLLITGGSSLAGTVAWNSGSGLVGDFNVSSNWVGGVAPGGSDTAAINNGGTNLGASTVNFTAGTTTSLDTLDLAAANIVNNRPVFNQTGGTLSVGTLHLGHANYGASKSPEYHLGGGVLNIATAWSFGNGTDIKFLASGGIVNYSGGNWITGNTGVAHQIALTNNASINFIPQKEIVLGGGGNSAGSSQLSLANNSSFTANTVTTILMGNDGTRGNTLTLADSASFTAPLATLALAQWNNGSSTLPASAAGTVTLGGSSVLNVQTVKTGGNNSGNPQWGVLNLNGGTLETSSIQIGSSSTAADLTHNVVNANGGTIRAKSDSVNFFQDVFLNIQGGGLAFDTNGYAVTVTNALAGIGGLTKKGVGTLYATNSALTYTGDTLVAEGELNLPLATFPDNANVSIASGAKIVLGSGLEDEIGTLVINGVTQPNGIYGSSASAAPPQNQNDAYFGGTGTFRVGPVAVIPRDLVWEGLPGMFWEANELETNFLFGTTPAAFRAYDNVTFSDKPDPLQLTVYLFGALQPSHIIFNNSTGNDYILDGNNGSIGGTTGIVKTGGGSVTLGGTGNTFSGPILINAGKMIMASNSAFGNSSGVTIASGAQVDINGRAPGVAYTYTVAGNGPSSAAIVNSGEARFGDSGIRNLILTGDTSIGNDGNRFDIGRDGTVTGNGFTLTKVGANHMGYRGDASGSPIHMVVAGGLIWAETSPNAFGGASGLLTIKAGARAGTYATLSIATPVNIESGGALINQGAGTGTWTGAVTAAGNVTIDSGGGPIEILGALNGTANITKTGGNNVTISNPGYIGNTAVNNGQLTLNTPSLNDGATVALSGTAKLSLPHGTTDTVAQLILDGVKQADGLYVSTTNNQGIPGAVATSFLVGNTGSIRVLSPATSDSYSSWADQQIVKPENATLKGKQDDPDQDGFSNLQEYLFGSLPEVANGSLTLLNRSGTDLIIRWNERPDATYILQESTTLSENTWPTSALVPTVDGDQIAVPTGYTRKQVSMPINGSHKFIRVSGAKKQ